jgi:hypothetical protein
MELQFYPPGWVLWPFGNSCDATRWCAALTIDSLSENLNTGQFNNNDCRANAGDEPINFAFVTRNGVPLGPPAPLTQTLATFTVDPNRVLMMNPGDKIKVTITDTANGIKVVIQDLTTGQSGTMVGGPANGFAQVNFQRTATTCSQTPYAFRPMYATSSERTRVVWAAHSYNIAASDEIGHWEYCKDATCSTPQDVDDNFCLPAAASSLIKVAGCTDTDIDFNGVSYQLVWPGTFSLFADDKKVHPSPIRFSSPRFMPAGSGGEDANDSELEEYNRVAFEADLPRIEFATTPPCNRTTGSNCVNPPKGANFYPFFTTAGDEDKCLWQLGGKNLPGTTNTFGGSSTAEFGPLLQLLYPGAGNTPIFRFNNFRQVLGFNPCRADN